VAQDFRGRLQRAIAADETEMGFIWVLDRVIVQAPRQRASQPGLLCAGEHDFIEPRLLGFRAGRGAHLRA
jgi:hypothetical protein